MKIYSKAAPTATFKQLEESFRADKLNTYVIALEKPIPDVMTSVNLQGKIDCKYVVGFFYNKNPRRPKLRSEWPPSPEENKERLEDAGFLMDRMVPKCKRCGEMGHIAKSCKQEYVAIDQPEVKCFICGEVGHRARKSQKTLDLGAACRLTCYR